MPLVWRRYSIRVPPGLDLDRFAERLKEAVRTPYVEVRPERDGKLSIVLVGVEADVRDSWFRIKSMVSELWELYSLARKGEVSIDAIVREIRRTFPPQALVEALQLRGFKAELVEGNVLRTNAPADVVIDMAARIAEVIDAIRFDVKGTAAKRVIAAVAAAFDVSPHVVIDVGLRADVFRETEDGKVELKREWRQAIRRLAVVFRAGGGKLVGEEDRDSEGVEE